MMTTTTTTYRGFNITDEELKKTVDSFYQEMNAEPMSCDAARLQLSREAAYRALQPHADIWDFKHVQIMQMMCVSGSPLPALVPNRIEMRHFSASSRVRNMVHGGMLGLLSSRLALNKVAAASCIIRRVNNENGHAHVKWSIPEFQCQQYMGTRYYNKSKSPFDTMAITEIEARMAEMDTPENRETFFQEVMTRSNDPGQSRVKRASCCIISGDTMSWRCPDPLANEWIVNYVNAFSKVCKHKLEAVNDLSLSQVDQGAKVIELFRFIAKNDWLFTDSVRHMINFNRFWNVVTDRLIYMAGNGIEHAACLMGKYYPEMMTHELHICVNPVLGMYRVPKTEIANDDALFVPLKQAVHALLPEKLSPPPPQPRKSIYSDSDDDYYDDDDDDDYDDDDYDDDDYDDYDDVDYDDYDDVDYDDDAQG